MPPMVSVCIPTYNRKDYLMLTLESVIAQSYTDFEIIIVDDGSVDGTAQMIKNIKFPVRYYWQKNKGDAGAKNKLIEMAQGRYISLLDSDDLLFEDSLSRLITRIDNREDCIAYGSYIRINSQGNMIGKDKRKLHSGFVTVPLFQNIFVHPNGSLIPRRIFEQCGGFDESLPVCSDYALFLDLSKEYEYLAVSAPTFKHRRHISNLSSRSFQNLEIELKVLEDFYFVKGGKDIIPRETAFPRLAAQACRAGKCAMQEKKYNESRQLLRKSLNYSFSFKAFLSICRTELIG